MTQALPSPQPVSISDEALVARAAVGDDAAFEMIMRRYNRRLFRTARAILRNDAEAEDALQEAYLQAFRSLPGFRNQSRLSTWLARIVANEAFMRLRRDKRRSEVVPLQRSPDSEELMEKVKEETGHGPEALAHRGEIRRALERHIDALPEAYRTVFVLRAVEDLSLEEIAAILGFPPATIRSRFFRARSRLREVLALEWEMACEDAFDFGESRCDRIVLSVLEKLPKHDSKGAGQ
jgi:RNA polymerase sigma-70 factor (ECF subfamily)